MKQLILIFAFFSIFLFAHAQAQNASQSGSQNTNQDSIDGMITFINKDTNSVYVMAGNFSEEFYLSIQTKLTSGGKEISLQNLQAGQKVTISYDTSNNQNELISLDVTSPVVKNPIKPQIQKVDVQGTIVAIEPFTKQVVINASTRSYTMNITTSTKITKNTKTAKFSDLQSGQKVQIKGQELNYVLYPNSIDINTTQ